ncbi:MAG: sigma 54-interacting transcriptional regulator [Bacillota bacterium]
MPASQTIIGNSAGIIAVHRLIRKVAPTDSTVLVRGESGTGKELVAQAIHAGSARTSSPFVTINCAALPETLLESELFGHARGAFTGAVSAKKGLFEEADGGTLFLDEIGDVSLALQAKLLRVLQEHEFMRIGETKPRQVDVRVIAATNRNLEQTVAAGSFRSELYYRLNVVSISLPALRERREDIPLLARAFLERFRLRTGRSLGGFAPEAMGALCGYDWPGNVRELENALERAVILCEGELIGLADLPEAIAGEAADIPHTGPPFREAVESFQRRLICDALERAGWIQSRAARSLGLKRTTLSEMMKRLGIGNRGPN